MATKGSQHLLLAFAYTVSATLKHDTAHTNVTSTF